MDRREPSSEETKARHPIGVISTRSGLAQDVLRAWERRYGAVVPQRTETGRRLYSDTDLEKLVLLREAVESGRRISDVASLSTAELRELVREDGASAAPSRPRASRTRTGPDRAAGGYVQAGLRAIEELDGQALDRVLRQASVDMSPPALRNDVIRPMLEAVGERWRTGHFRIANEHLGTAVIRSFLGARLNGGAAPGGSTVVVATPVGQRHELGALLVATAALEVGWDAVYLGPDLPAAEIAAAARLRQARAVALSIVCPGNDPRVADDLRELRNLLGQETAVLVGGASASTYEKVLIDIGALRIDEPVRFQEALEDI